MSCAAFDINPLLKCRIEFDALIELRTGVGEKTVSNTSRRIIAMDPPAFGWR
jgi:hypothetical protein